MNKAETLKKDVGKPYTADPGDRLKIMRNSVLKYDDPTEPVAPEDWKELQ